MRLNTEHMEQFKRCVSLLFPRFHVLDGLTVFWKPPGSHQRPQVEGSCDLDLCQTMYGHCCLTSSISSRRNSLQVTYVLFNETIFLILFMTDDLLKLQCFDGSEESRVCSLSVWGNKHGSSISLTERYITTVTKTSKAASSLNLRADFDRKTSALAWRRTTYTS